MICNLFFKDSEFPWESQEGDKEYAENIMKSHREVLNEYSTKAGEYYFQ
jgi:hypothetical protein